MSGNFHATSTSTIVRYKNVQYAFTLYNPCFMIRMCLLGYIYKKFALLSGFVHSYSLHSAVCTPIVATTAVTTQAVASQIAQVRLLCILQFEYYKL